MILGRSRQVRSGEGFDLAATAADVDAVHAGMQADAVEEVGGVGPACAGKQLEPLVSLPAARITYPLHAGIISTRRPQSLVLKARSPLGEC